MVVVLRLIALTVFALLMFVFGCGYCLLSPRNPKHVYTFGRMFSRLSWLFGVKLVLRLPESLPDEQYIFVANHQSNWDLVTVSSAITPKTVTVGKKSLAWLPLFGQLYWLSGNILIDRANRSKAHGTIDQVIQSIKQTDVSIWMFPEGTRSRGRGLLPFKAGAFHAAVGAQVSVVPIVCSTTAHLKVNRWRNGYVIVEMLPPIPTKQLEKEDVRQLAKSTHELMQEKLESLNQEVTELNRQHGIGVELSQSL